MDKPDISILVMTRNHEHFITATLESVLEQQYAGTLQLIISNDASSDQTDTVIRNFLEKTVVPTNVKVE